jgi:hypothetical protein
MRFAPAAGLALLLAAAPAAPGDDAKQSAHYVLRARGDCPEAGDLVKFAEAAYGRLLPYFGKAPSEKKLEIEYFADLMAYNEKLKADGLPDENYAPDGRYLPYTKKAYARRLKWDWDTRRALLDVLVDQFMSLSVVSRQNKGMPTWYRGGLSCHLFLHRWDGKTLTVGEEDDPGPWGREIAKVCDQAREGTFDPTAGIREDSRVFMETWPLVHYCLASGDRAMYARFRAVERRIWDGIETKEASDALLGQDARKVKDLVKAWYAARTPTWTTVRDLWERTAEDGFVGIGQEGQEAILRATAESPPAAFVEATIAPGEGAEGGVILLFDPTGGFLQASFDPGGKVVLEKYAAPGSGQALASADAPPGTEARLRVEVQPGGVVKVLAGGKEAISWTAPSPESLGKGSAGLYARGGRVRFTGVKASGIVPPKK